VSLLEAHAHARVLGSSIDVPTLTSERFLRYAVSPEAASEMGVAPADDPVERYVVERLGVALDLTLPPRMPRVVREGDDLEELHAQPEERLVGARGGVGEQGVEFGFGVFGQ